MFEGIMGAGKSTATRAFTERIRASGVAVAGYTERHDPHPVRASDDLPDFFRPWLHVDAAELASRVRAKWARHVDARLADGVFSVMDGQLFHGDLTNLFMMEMPAADLRAHVAGLMAVLAPLNPVVVHLRPSDVRRALQAVFRERGAEWESYQLAWKLASPFAKSRGLSGPEGLAVMYEEYRALTDSLFESLACTKLAIETDNGDWPARYEQIARLLDA